MTSDNAKNLLESCEMQLDGEELVGPDWRFQLSKIESVQLQRIITAATGPILMIASGVICLLSSFGDGGMMRAMMGVGLLIPATIWWVRKKPRFQVHLHMAGEDAIAFESPDEQFAAQVLAAIEDARVSPESG